MTIPIALRRKLGIKPGTRLIVREEKGQIVVMTLESYVRSLRGKYKDKRLMEAFIKDRLSERSRKKHALTDEVGA